MLLDVEGLDIRYGRTLAVAALDLRVSEGEIVTVLGANGAGKSSLLKGLRGRYGPRPGVFASVARTSPAGPPRGGSARAWSLCRKAGRSSCPCRCTKTC